jgi:hypothetical protein
MGNIEFKSGKYPLIFKRDNNVVSGCFPEHKWEINEIINSTHPLLKGGFKVKNVIEQRN